MEIRYPTESSFWVLLSGWILNPAFTSNSLVKEPLGKKAVNNDELFFFLGHRTLPRTLF